MKLVRICTYYSVTGTPQTQRPSERASFDFNYSAIIYNATHATISFTPLDVTTNQSLSYCLMKTKNFKDTEEINLNDTTSIVIPRHDLEADDGTDYKLYVEAFVDMSPNFSNISASALAISQNGKDIINPNRACARELLFGFFCFCFAFFFGCLYCIFRVIVVTLSVVQHGIFRILS